MIEKIFGTMGLSGSREQEKALITLVRRKADKVVWLARGTLSPPKAKDQSVDVNTFPAVDFSQLANVDGEMTSIDA